MSFPDYPGVTSPNNGPVLCAEEHNREQVEGIFMACCHRDFRVDEIYPMPSIKKPYCRWLVKYCRKVDGDMPPFGNELKQTFKTLIRCLPIFAKVLSRHPVDAKSVMIIYGVECDCETHKDFEKATEPSYQLWSLVNKKEMHVLIDM